jgi:hypothetical protein
MFIFLVSRMWLMTPKDLNEHNVILKNYPGKSIWIGYSRSVCFVSFSARRCQIIKAL